MIGSVRTAGLAGVAAGPRRSAGLSTALYHPFGIFRTFLAVLVMLHHFGIHLADAETAQLFRELNLGRVAVMVFFVLSGFVIVEAAALFYDARPLAFVTNRLLRIVPPFVAAIFLSWAAQSILFAAGFLNPLEGEAVNTADLDASALLANLLAILPGAHLLNDLPDYLLIRYVWAVRVELLFYLLVAACLVVSLAISAGRSRTPVCLAIAGSGACIIALLGPIFGLRLGALEFAPYFVFGAALFHLVQSPRAVTGVPGLITGMASVGIFVHASLLKDGTWVGAQGVCLGLCVAFATWLATARPTRLLGQLDRSVGALSYPLYLNHFLAGTIVASLLPNSGIVGLLMAVVLALVLAVAMNLLIEPVIGGLRNHVRGRRVNEVFQVPSIGLP